MPMAVLSLLLLLAGPMQSEPADALVTDESLGMTPAARHAIARGLDYLAARQREDGSLTGSRGTNTGIVSFAALSFLATGQMPGRGPHGESIARSIAFVLDHVQPSGLISNAQDASNGPMYEHAMSALLLAEVTGDYED